MGYHKCHIPDLETLKKQYDNWGISKFVTRYSKCEAMIGDSNAIGFIEEKIKEYNNR